MILAIQIIYFYILRQLALSILYPTIEEAKKRLREALELYFESAPWERERLIKIENGVKN